MGACCWQLPSTACGGDDGGSSPPPAPSGGTPIPAPRHASKRSKREARSRRFRRRADQGPCARPAASLARSRRRSGMPSAGDGSAAASISTLGPVAATATDVGDIAVIRDEGDLIVPPNTFDLRGPGPAFHPQRQRRLRRPADRRRVPHHARQPAHARQTTTALRANVPFSFPSSTATSADARVRQLRRQRHLRGRATAPAPTATSPAC